MAGLATHRLGLQVKKFIITEQLNWLIKQDFV